MNPKKHFFISLLATVLLLCIPLLCAAQEVPALNFVQRWLDADQKFPVYSAPSSSSWRGAKGKAAVSTNDAVWIAGWEDDWLLVMYETSKGAVRVGYIDGTQVRGYIPEAGELSFARTEVSVTAKCTLTDDTAKRSTKIETLKKGTTVTFLAEYGDLSYIETTYKKKQIRGFVKTECLDLSGVEAAYAAMEETQTEDEPDAEEADSATGAEEEAEPSSSEDETAGEPAASGAENTETAADTENTENTENTDESPAEDIQPDETSGEPSSEETQNGEDTQPADPENGGNADSGPQETASSDASTENQNGTQPDENGTAAEPIEAPEIDPGSAEITVKRITPVEVPEPAQPKNARSSAGESTVSDAGADWYGICYSVNDDIVDYYLYETDSRGYLKTVPSGYSFGQCLDTYNFGSDGACIAYELPNGDILAEVCHKPSVSGITCGYAIFRPSDDGLVTLFSSEYTSVPGWGDLTDYRAGRRLSFKATPYKYHFSCEEAPANETGSHQ